VCALSQGSFPWFNFSLSSIVTVYVHNYQKETNWSEELNSFYLSPIQIGELDEWQQAVSKYLNGAGPTGPAVLFFLFLFLRLLFLLLFLYNRGNRDTVTILREREKWE